MHCASSAFASLANEESCKFANCNYNQLEFSVESETGWDAHPICFTAKKYQYSILADSSNGIMMVECGNFLGCNFYISKCYPQSVLFLQEFIEVKAKEILNNTKENPKHDKHKKDKLIDELEKKSKVKIKLKSGGIADFYMAKESTYYSKEETVKRLANHVGIGINKKKAIYANFNSLCIDPVKDKPKFPAEPLILTTDSNNIPEVEADPNRKVIITMDRDAVEKMSVDNPAGRYDELKKSKIKPESPKHIKLPKNGRSKIEIDADERETKKKVVIKKKATSHLYSGNNTQMEFRHKPENNVVEWTENVHYLKNLSDDQLAGFYLRQSREKVNQLVKEAQMAAVEKKEINGFTLSTIDHGKKKLTLSFEPKNKPSKENVKKEQVIEPYVCEYDKVLTDKEYRKNMFHNLYPYINYELIPKGKDVHIPGYSIEKIHLQREVHKIDTNRQVFYNNYNKNFRCFEKELNSFADKCFVRSSSEYITKEELKRKEDLQSKKKWVATKDFQRAFSAYTRERIESNDKVEDENDDYGDSTIPTETSNSNSHKFREINKTKWIGSNFNFKY